MWKGDGWANREAELKWWRSTDKRGLRMAGSELWPLVGRWPNSKEDNFKIKKWIFKGKKGKY